MISARELLGFLRPTDEEIAALALRETDPGRAGEFDPIARGPVFAVAAMVLIGLAAIPSCLFRAVRGLVRASQRSE